MLNNYKSYLIRQVEKRPIRVLLNTEATPDLVEHLHTAPVVEPVGNCIAPATVRNASRTGFYVARNL